MPTFTERKCPSIASPGPLRDAATCKFYGDSFVADEVQLVIDPFYSTTATLSWVECAFHPVPEEYYGPEKSTAKGTGLKRATEKDEKKTR